MLAARELFTGDMFGTILVVLAVIGLVTAMSYILLGYWKGHR
jgi:hypothetical protein